MFLNKQKNEMNIELEKTGSEWGAVQYGLGMFGPWQWGGDGTHTTHKERDTGWKPSQ